MSDGQVSVDGKTYELPRPFMVIATQNPFEFEGTYTLPESQLDRFLLRISMGYPDREDERQAEVGRERVRRQNSVEHGLRQEHREDDQDDGDASPHAMHRSPLFSGSPRPWARR